MGSAGSGHCSRLPPRTWRQDFVAEDITHFGPGTWKNKADIDLEASSCLLAFMVLGSV